MNIYLKKILICAASSLLAISSLAACSSSNNEVDSIKAAVSPNYEKSLENDLYKYDVFNDHIVITSYIGNEETVTIPETIDEKSVTGIAMNSFTTCDESVKTVKIPKTVTAIEGNSFSGNKFEKIEIDADNPSYIIENNAIMDKAKTTLLAFAGGSDTEEFSIPDTVTSISSGVFSSCPNLKTVNIPSSVKTIDTFAFMGSGLTQAVLPEGVEELGMGAFWNCKSLETLELPQSLKTIYNPETICQSCTSLKTVKGYDSTDAKEIIEGEEVSAEYISLG